ncbi:MAG: extracellular solute-binding protein [Christensenellales bacterium]|jgi:putative aldouronate transport system substrate-binding protein
MKKHVKIPVLLLAVIMIFTMFAGCSKTSSDKPSEDAGQQEAAMPDYVTREVGGLGLPLCAEKEELTIWLVYSGAVVTDLNDIEGVKRMEENTNVHINWIPVEQNELRDKYGILLSSGEYPDIIYANMAYPGGFEKGVEDGVIHPDMDTLIRTYMPNYMALINSSDQARREASSDAGKLLVARTIVGQDKTAESEGTYQGLAYRADLLEDLGLDVPTTVEEWHEALVAAKDAGIEAPFNLDQNGGSPLALAWGVATDNWLQLDGDKVVCGATLPTFEGYLETMKQWYSEGLINPNFTSFHYYLTTPESVNSNQCLLYSRVLSAFTGKNYVNYRMVTEQPDAFLQAIPMPVLKAGDEVIQYGNRLIAKEGAYITTSCKNPELAAKWLDYQYSEEGQYLNWYGIEGVTYEIGEDGTPVFTDIVFNNDTGMSPSDFLQKYALNQGQSWLGKHDVSASWKISTAAAGGQNQELISVAIWSEPKTNIYLTDTITLTEAEGDEANTKMTALRTMIEEYTVNYIIGQEVKPFEEFQKDLIEFGVEDVVAIYQAGYNRFLAR